MSLMNDQVACVVGVANERSLAWGVAQALQRQGARVCLTYQNDRLRRRVEQLAQQLGGWATCCDVAHEADLVALAAAIGERWGRLDLLVHAVAAARREDLGDAFVTTERAGFAMAMDISVFSLVTLAQHLRPWLAKGRDPAVLTLSYLAATRVVPAYNVMGVAKAALEAAVRYLAHDMGPQGIRVNALSAGPVKTLSSAAIPGLRSMLRHVAHSAPLRRNIDIDEVGDAAVCALSRMMRATTGAILPVDAGYHAMGAPASFDAPAPAVTAGAAGSAEPPAANRALLVQ